jgi:hypothetical protein
MSFEPEHVRVDDGELYLVGEDGHRELGSLEDVYHLVDGEEYTIEYDEDAATAGWLQVADDGTHTFDVRDAIDEMPFGRPYADRVIEEPMEENNEGIPRRTVAFADILTQIWEAKGNAKKLSEFHDRSSETGREDSIVR